jgi:hypothetical protein
MLSGFYRLGARVFLHDIMLRGVTPFAIYDPQSLRNDALFLEFMSDIVESEIRGLDNTYFRLMLQYIKKNYEFRNNKQIPKESEKLITRLLYREFIKAELQTSVLPKMTKRIYVDTNELITKNIADPAEAEQKKIKLKDIYDSILKESIISTNRATVKLKNFNVFNSRTGNTGEALLREFRGSPQFKIIFEYLFPLTKYLTFFFIDNVLATSTRKQIVNSFRDTKKAVISTTKLVHTDGRGYTADTENIQDTINENSGDYFLKFLFMAAIKTPISIFKGYVEVTEPNLTISTSIYQIAKVIIPDTPSFLIPAISIPAYFLGLPFINPIYGWLYLGTFLWYENNSRDEEVNKYNALNDFLNGQTQFCQALKDNNSDANRDATKLTEILPLEGKRYQIITPVSA